MGGQADDEVSAKKLIKKALKKGPMPLAALRTSVVAALVASGKDEKKARKVFESKVALPLFSMGSNGTVALAGGKAEPAEPAPTGKRPAAEAPPAKKSKNGGAAEPAPASAASSSVTMMSPAEAAKYCAEHSITLTGGGADAFRPIPTFASSGFSKDALAATAKFERPTPIQAVCWPIIAASRDVIGVAETGSGKTLAFFLPAIALIRAAGRAQNSSGENVRMLCLEPTRELAMQTEVVCASAGNPCGIRSICVYGGVPKGPQLSALRGGAQVVIATPGRLLDLYQNDGVCDLSSVQYLVLDEADRMLDMGFEKDVRAIIAATPPTRRTVMFTATWPEEVEVLENPQKERRLLELLKKFKPTSTNRVLVFALYKKEAARVEHMLKGQGYNCVAIQGDMTQAARTASLDSFKQGAVPLLVATDVAARGLDIPMVEVVINFTFPLTIEDYVHRIGRTGRGGRTGHAHTFFTSFDKAHAGALQNILREASQPVPDALTKFGSTVKKKEHKLYGAYGPKEGEPMKSATKIVFGE